MGFPFDGLKSLVQSAAATVAQLVGQAISVASIVASGNGTFGSVTVTTPGDLTLGVGSDINLGNDTNSRIRGGSGFLRLDNAIGSQLFYTGSTLTLDGNASLTNTAGRFSVSGDTTSPALPAFRIVPQDTEPTGPNLVGDLYINSGDAKLYICTVAGSPGTWVVVGTQS